MCLGEPVLLAGLRHPMSQIGCNATMVETSADGCVLADVLHGDWFSTALCISRSAHRRRSGWSAVGRPDRLIVSSRMWVPLLSVTVARLNSEKSWLGSARL